MKIEERLWWQTIGSKAKILEQRNPKSPDNGFLVGVHIHNNGIIEVVSGEVLFPDEIPEGASDEH